MRPRWLLAAVPLLTPTSAAPLDAQVALNHATSYLHPTDVRDARAVWVNPAELAIRREASVYAELVVGDPGARGRVRQLSAGFNARGLSFAYQRDVFTGGTRGHTYRIGLAGASEGVAAGAAVARYGGSTRAMGWDVGLSYSWGSALTLGGVLANVGQPVVRGLRQRFTWVPGITWRPAAGVAAISGHARITPDSVVGLAFGTAWHGGGRRGGRWPLGVLLRLDTDGGFRRGAFALGVSLGGPDRVGLVLSTPGDVSGLDAVSVSGLSAREASARR